MKKKKKKKYMLQWLQPILNKDIYKFVNPLSESEI